MLTRVKLTDHFTHFSFVVLKRKVWLRTCVLRVKNRWLLKIECVFEKSLKEGCNFLFEPRRSSSVGRALDCTNSRLTVVGSIPGARSILRVLNDNCEMGELPLPCKCLDFHSDNHLKWWSRLLKELNKMVSSVFVLNTITVQ